MLINPRELRGAQVTLRTAKVRCCGEHHRISIMAATPTHRGHFAPGRIVLHDHQGTNDSFEAARLMNPELACRCLEVLTFWQVAIGLNPYPSSSHYPPWLRRALEYEYQGDSWRYEKGPTRESDLTESFAFHKLPKPFRDIVELAVADRQLRREMYSTGCLEVTHRLRGSGRLAPYMKGVHHENHDSGEDSYGTVERHLRYRFAHLLWKRFLPHDMWGARKLRGDDPNWLINKKADWIDHCLEPPWRGDEHALFNAHTTSYGKTVMGTPLARLGNSDSIQIVAAPPHSMWERSFTCQALDLDEVRDDDGRQDSLPISNLSLSHEAPVLSHEGLSGLVTGVFWVRVYQDRNNNWHLEAL